MYEGSVTVIIVVLFVLIGIVSYTLYDYYGYKVKVSSDIATEKSERLGNVKSIVDQVNEVHDGIGSELDQLNNDATTFERGMQRMLKFKTKTGTNSYKEIPLSELPGANEPDVNLLTHVTSVGGLTIKDLDKSQSPEKTLQVCGGNPTKCIKIPDENGDVVLTNLYTDKAIALDGKTVITAPLSFTSAGKLGAKISTSSENTVNMDTNAFGIRPVNSTTTTPPQASLHIQAPGGTSASTLPPFKVSIGTEDVLNVGTDGVLTAKSIKLQSTGATPKIVTLSMDTNGLKINTGSTRVRIDGNLDVTGNIRTGGTINATGLITPSTSNMTIEPFTGQPIVMPSSYTKKPADYMNASYLLPLSDVVSAY